MIFKTFIALLLFSISLNAATDKPNVLLIMADDIGFECYSTYGSEFYKTPNIDKLAASAGAVTFAKAYCQQAVCGTLTLSCNG